MLKVFLLLLIRYINEDTSIVPMLKMLRDSGRSTFLVTNRYSFYFNVFLFVNGVVSDIH